MSGDIAGLPPPPPEEDPTYAAAVASAGALPYELADYGERLGAACIDFLVRLGILLAPVAVGALLLLVSENAGIGGLIGGAVIGYILSSFVYSPVMIARTNGQTVGHRIVNTRIIKVDGSPMTGGQAFLREVIVKWLLIETVGSFLFYVLTIVNYLFPLWDSKNEALHDKMCGTRVIKA